VHHLVEAWELAWSTSPHVVVVAFELEERTLLAPEFKEANEKTNFKSARRRISKNIYLLFSYFSVTRSNLCLLYYNTTKSCKRKRKLPRKRTPLFFSQPEGASTIFPQQPHEHPDRNNATIWSARFR